MRTPLYFSPKYNTDLTAFGLNKPFALDRGELVLRRLAEDLERKTIEELYTVPEPITGEEIRLVHTDRYLKSLEKSETWFDLFELKPEEYFPDSATMPLPAMIDDILLKCGGTRDAAHLCLETGLAANLGGGYHHAFPDQGRGYCVIHDIAIAIKSLQKHSKIKRAMIVDLDFHQGDGSAKIFAQDESVFTMSVHSDEGWPDHKQKSSLDIPILSADADNYLEAMKDGIDRSLAQFAPDMVIYVGGSDPYEKDVLPGTKFIQLPLNVMKERDFYVIDRFAAEGIPLAMVFAGGYGPHVWEVHYWATRRLLERIGISVEDATRSTS